MDGSVYFPVFFISLVWFPLPFVFFRPWRENKNVSDIFGRWSSVACRGSDGDCNLKERSGACLSCFKGGKILLLCEFSNCGDCGNCGKGTEVVILSLCCYGDCIENVMQVKEKNDRVCVE